MADESPSSFVDNIFGLANRFATPFAQNLADDSIGTTDGGQDKLNSLLQERLAINALNGSGAANPYLASQAPQGILDVILGQSPRSGQSGVSTASMLTPWVLLIGLLAFAAYWMKR